MVFLWPIRSTDTKYFTCWRSLFSLYLLSCLIDETLLLNLYHLNPWKIGFWLIPKLPCSFEKIIAKSQNESQWKKWPPAFFVIWRQSDSLIKKEQGALIALIQGDIDGNRLGNMDILNPWMMCLSLMYKSAWRKISTLWPLPHGLDIDFQTESWRFSDTAPQNLNNNTLTCINSKKSVCWSPSLLNYRSCIPNVAARDYVF